MPDIEPLSPARQGATPLELATLALRLEHLEAQLQAGNIARVGAGSPTVFRTALDSAYAAVRAAAESPETSRALLDAANADLRQFAGVVPEPTPANASLDDLVMSMNRTSSRYSLLADVIARQYNLVELAIRGSR